MLFHKDLKQIRATSLLNMCLALLLVPSLLHAEMEQVMQPSQVSASQEMQMPAQQPAQNTGETICQRMRMNRQQEINRNPSLKLLVPLRKSSDANCFSPAENLYLTSLVVAQMELGPNAPWYQTMGNQNKEKARLACEVMGYGSSPQTLSMDECITARYGEMMRPYNDEYRTESTTYIGKRNNRGEVLVQQCVTAFYQNLPQLPKQIQFPLAYYDRKLHSYPDWYLESRLEDTEWLSNMQKTMASQVIREALVKQCPGDMIWWLYLST
ncbi:hypothetical protein [Parendozoicomonas sp. Alg238-R29]|uniref:hypothetical protein n=1 Tax=Parendozoicomonas sp. Alg238-R29 TaxID=2993446 RepID=UPI00248F39D0|nr:hypothetical protein [Parendozoicomonas sp. Alg238-R29]